MEERELVQYGIYHHFKGNNYIVMGVSYPLPSQKFKEFKTNSTFNTSHTERETSKRNILVKNSGDGLLYHDASVCDEILVIYRNVDNDGPIWAKPRWIFIGPVDKVKYPSVDQYYKAELIDPSKYNTAI